MISASRIVALVMQKCGTCRCKVEPFLVHLSMLVHCMAHVSRSPFGEGQGHLSVKLELLLLTCNVLSKNKFS